MQTLIDNKHLEDEGIVRAFLAVDRRWFLPPDDGSAAYEDRALLKEGNIHHSTPHIYAMALTQLALQPGHSFLNIGSGQRRLHPARKPTPTRTGSGLAVAGWLHRAWGARAAKR